MVANMLNEPIVKSSDSIPADVVGAGTGTKRQVLISDQDAPNFALRRFIMEPSGGMPKHTNSVEHEQYILRGKARVGIGDTVFGVKAGDAVFIPELSSMKIDDSDLDKFKMNMYVMCSRARTHLSIFVEDEYSPVLRHLPDEKLNILEYKNV